MSKLFILSEIVDPSCFEVGQKEKILHVHPTQQVTGPTVFSWAQLMFTRSDKTIRQRQLLKPDLLRISEPVGPSLTYQYSVTVLTAITISLTVKTVHAYPSNFKPLIGNFEVENENFELKLRNSRLKLHKVFRIFEFLGTFFLQTLWFAL